MTGPVSENVVWHDTGIPRAERWRAAGLAGATIWFTGLSGLGQVDGGVGAGARGSTAARRGATTCSTATTCATG